MGGVRREAEQWMGGFPKGLRHGGTWSHQLHWEPDHGVCSAWIAYFSTTNALKAELSVCAEPKKWEAFEGSAVLHSTRRGQARPKATSTTISGCFTAEIKGSKPKARPSPKPSHRPCKALMRAGPGSGLGDGARH